jgi:hypothetical protein
MSRDAAMGQAGLGWQSVPARQRIAAARRIAGETLDQIGRFCGVSHQAISKRLHSFEKKLSPRQLELYRRSCRHRYGKALASGGRRIRIKDLKV